MLDYYGSIIMDENEIISRIIDSYQGKNYKKEHLETIISNYMDENKISRECSVSGWMVFLGKDYIKMVEEKYLSDLDDAEKKLAFTKIVDCRLGPDYIGEVDPEIIKDILK